MPAQIWSRIPGSLSTFLPGKPGAAGTPEIAKLEHPSMGADKKSFLFQNPNRPSDGYHLLNVCYHMHIYSPKTVISISHMKILRQTGLREVNSCALVPPMNSSLSKPRVCVPTLHLPRLPQHDTCLPYACCQHNSKQLFSTCGPCPLWESNNTFTGVA